MKIIEHYTQREVAKTRTDATGLSEKVVHRDEAYTRITRDEPRSARTTRRKSQRPTPQRFGRITQRLLTAVLCRLLVALITCISICTSPSPIEVGPPHELEGQTSVQDIVEVDASPFDINCR